MTRPVQYRMLFSFLLLIATACHYRQGVTVALKAPKRVPGAYHPAGDTAFSNHQDTLFYKGRYFSGYVLSQYANGDTSAITGYLNGVREGTCRKWYPNKQLAEERLYIDGKKEGIHKGWWPNGRLKYVFEVSNDEYTGSFREWYRSGLPARYFHYKNGQEDGSEKMWWPDGALRANYVIKNGEKFGLLGQKLCINNNLKSLLK